MNIDSKQRTQLALALGAIVALVLGYSVFGKSDDSAKTSQNAQRGNFPGQGQMAPGGYGGPPGQSGQSGPGGGRMPQQVTGSAATKAKAAALKKVDGTAEIVMKSRSGSGYTVIVRTDDGVTMVELDKSFKVTDTRAMQGGPPGQGGQSGPPAMQGDGTQ